MNFFIYSYSYDENSGGVIALHRLCHIINTTTSHHAFLVSDKWAQPWLKRIHSKLKKKKILNVHEGWETPIWTRRQFPEDAIVIYPEVVKGNPLGIRHVVRWLLHQPGFHTSQIHYGKNELYFKFNSAINDFQRESCTLAQHEMKVIYYPIDTYANRGLSRDMILADVVLDSSVASFALDMASLVGNKGMASSSFVGYGHNNGPLEAGDHYKVVLAYQTTHQSLQA